MSQHRFVHRRQRWSAHARGVAAAALSALLLVGCGETPEEMLASAKTYIEKKDLDAASIQLKNALQANANMAEARFLLGRVNARQGNVAGAVKEFQRAAELGHPRDEVAREFAPVLVRAGELDKLFAEFSDPRVTDPKVLAIVLTALGDAHLMKREVDKAHASYQQALAANADEHEASLGLARTTAIKGDPAKAEELVRETVKRAPDLAGARAMFAEVLIARGDATQGVAEMREALRLQPRSVEYHYALVSQLLRQGANAEADEALKAMLAAAASHPSTRYLQAMIDFRENRLIEARDGLMKVLKDTPQFLPAELLAGTVRVRLNEHTLARSHLSRVLQAMPGNRVALQALIVSHLATGESKRALELLQPLLQQPGPSARMLGLAGQVFVANGDFERAEEYFERAAKAAPEDARALTRLGVARMAGGDLDAAFSDLVSAARMDEGGIQADLALVMAYLRRGETDKALAAQTELERKQPDSALAYNLRGGLMLARQDVPAARAAFDKALSIQPGYLAAAVNLARLDLAERKSADAVARIKAVVDRDPKSVEALLTLAEIQRVTGAAPIEVLATLERAEAVSPGAVVPSLAIVQHHLQQQQAAPALQVAQKTASAHENDPRALEALARAQLAAGDSQQAISALNRLVALQPEAPMPLVVLADVHRSLKDEPAAEQALRKALGVAPDLIDAKQRLIALLVERGDRAGALQLARETQARQADRPTGYLLEGDLHTAGGNWSEAAAAYRKAVDRKGDGQAAIRLHVALTRANRKADADRMATEWLKANPTDLALRGYLGEVALGEKRYADAAKLFGRMHEMAPQNALILNNLAWAAKEVKDPKALEYAEQALRLAPDNAAIIDTVGMIQVEQGQVEAGLANLRRAVSIGPDLLPLQLNLASALVKAGLKDEARTQLEALMPRLKEGTPLYQDARALQAGL
ncbi:XrtA/PEP-CTERM system TPR-repeat protein PrsT [Thauera sp.]|uniref:XrtA/PEP-CTERM system TPR-repeat protein PrsT n=1 Tax=Thauera sp. TaxID=1905334 RepID=UPI0026022192|nr:XrtA/PEP-CTERM system TPR-repeat protein PrsT [Thauera sp.]